MQHTNFLYILSHLGRDFLYEMKEGRQKGGMTGRTRAHFISPQKACHRIYSNASDRCLMKTMESSIPVRP